MFRPVIRLLENALHNGHPVILLDLGHRVIAQPVLAHPLEAFLSGPIPA